MCVFNDTATTESYTLALHDALPSSSTTIRWHSGLLRVIALAIACSTIVLPAFGGETISARWPLPIGITRSMTRVVRICGRSEEHTSELQSRQYLVCRLLLEKQQNTQ